MAYVAASEVYRELGTALSPWAQTAGFTRVRGSSTAWEKPIEQGRRLVVRFEGSSRFVDSATGHALDGRFETAADQIERQALFTTCLLQPELDRLARIHGTINARRPPLAAEMLAHLDADSLLGLHLRGLYDRSPHYREGQYVPLAYYDLEDVRALLAFVVETVPVALDRFLAGTNPKAIDTTPSHLKPKWLRSPT